MQVSSVNLLNRACNLSKKVTKPITNSKNITTLGIGAACVSGMYIAQKSKQEHKDFESLNLDNQTINKFLSAKTKDGQKVFDKKGIEMLSDVSKIEDSLFYETMKQNAEYIDTVKQFKEKDYATYEMHAKTPKGDIIASLGVSKEEINVFVKERQGLNQKTTSRVITKDEVIETVENRQKAKLISVEKNIFNKRKNIYRNEQIDIEDKKTVTSYNQYKVSENGEKAEETNVVYDISDKNNIKGIATTKDYKNNTEITSVIGDYFNKLYSQTKTFNDSGSTIKLVPSDIDGVYNSVITNKNGQIKTESSGIRNNDGSYSVEKHFESLDGTKTDYQYTSSKDNSDIKMNYKITSANGKELANVSRTFKRISPNLAYSSVNGHEYVIEKKGNSLTVTDKTLDNKTTINIDELCYDDETKNHLELFDEMSGDMLLDMYKRGYKFSYIAENRRSAMQVNERYINAKDDLFIFAHEQGHTKDFIGHRDFDYNKTDKSSNQYRITSNPEVRKIYEEERALFLDKFSEIEKDFACYLTDKEMFGEPNGSLAEAVAETNALFSTKAGSTSNSLWGRDYYFQKYFPRTIAEISKHLI